MIRFLAAALISATTAAAAPVIPWRPERPAGNPEPPLAKPCDTGMLRGSLFLQGATGSLVGGAVLTNIGRAKCSLRGRVAVKFVRGSADRTNWTVVAGKAQPRDRSAVYDRDSSLRALAPGRAAYVPIWWSNWCPPGTVETSGGVPPDALIIGLPHGRGSLELPVSRAPRCDAPGNPSTIVVGPLTRRGRYPPSSAHLPLRATIAAPSIAVGSKKLPTLRARRGRTLTYIVTLTNVSRRLYRFRQCPVYMQHLAPGGRDDIFVLNCRPAGTLQPGESARFAMRLAIPAETKLGAHGLTWELAPTTPLPPFASVRVIVSRS